MKTKNLLLGLALSTLTLQSCNVLDIDPTDTYSESTAYASIKNLDLYVKSFYNVFYSNADINVGANLAMDDGVSDLIKYSWFNVAEGSVNKLFYYDNMMSPDANYRSNWDDMYEQIRRFNEYFYDVHSGFADNLDSDQLAIRTAEVRFMRAFAYQELVLRHGGVILRINEDRVDDHNQRAKARSSEEDCWTFILDEYEKAAQILPEEWTGSEAGRLTKGAAYGMKARAALYAKRWQDAVNAALEVEKLEKKGVYQLLSGTSKDSYMQIFNTVNNKELILPVYFQQKTKQHMFNHFFCPPYDTEKAGLQPGTLGAAATPTDEYASAFDIKVGKDWKSFDWTHLNEYSEGPWGNRDPRFYASILYNGMLSPVVGYGIRGCLWYQGEANVDAPDLYTQLFPSLVSDWRKQWGIGEFPFYYAQIAPFNYNKGEGKGKNSAYLREAQVKCLHLIPSSGMVVLTDVGDARTIHPMEKETVGNRFAYLALGRTYGKKGFPVTGPLYKSMQTEDDKIILSFDEMGKGLTTYRQPLNGFEVAGEDRVFHPAHARFGKDVQTVIVSSPEVEQPVAVRYAFKDYVKGCLYNMSGLPASSFRTDNW